MKKLVSFALLISLSLMLVVPVAALAKGGPPEGKGPGSTPPGQAKKAAATAGAVATEAEAEEPAEESAPADKAAKKAEKAAVKAERKGSHEGPVAAMVGASEESETPAPETEEPAKLTGIANALSRIMANIERAEARVAAGEKSAVPPGLLKVLAKFMGWLGIDAEPDTETGEPEVTDPTEGSEEETGTLLPDEGSEEGTVTVTPEITE